MPNLARYRRLALTLWLACLLLSACGDNTEVATTGQSTTQPTVTTPATTTIAPTTITATPTPTTAPASRLELKYSTPGNPNHNGRINALTYSPNGQYLVTVGDDKVIRFWQNDQIVKTLKGHYHPINALAFSRDSKIMASGDDFCYIKLWDVESGKELLTLYGTPNWETAIDGVLSLAFSPDSKTLASGQANNILTLWDIATQKPRLTIKNYMSEVRGKSEVPHVTKSLDFSPDGKSIIGISQNRDRSKISFWDTTTGLETANRVGNGFFATALSPDGKMLAAADFVNVNLYDTNSHTLLASFKVDSTVIAVAFSPDGKTMAAGTNDIYYSAGRQSPHIDGFVKAWSIADKREVGKFECQCYGLTAITFSPDNQKIISSDDAGDVIKVDLRTRQSSLIRGYVNNGRAITLSWDGKWLAFAISQRDKNDLQILNAATGQLVTTIKDVEPSAVFSSDSGFIIASNGRNVPFVRMYDVSNGQIVKTFDRNNQADLYPIDCGFEVSPDSKILATYGRADGIALWDTDSGKLLRVLKGKNTAQLEGVVFSPDSRYLISYHYGLTLWEVASGKELKAFEGWLQRPIFRADGKFVAALDIATRPETARVYELASGKELAAFASDYPPSQDYSTLVYSTTMAFSPNGQLLAVKNYNGTVTIYNIASRKVQAKFKGHAGWQRQIFFTPDSQSLITADDTIELWNVSDGKQISTTKIQDSVGLQQLLLSSDGTFLISSHQDGSIKRWQIK